MSTSFTLNGWRTSTANGLVASLPLQTFDDSLPLIDEYLAAVGGWIPNEPTDPTGQGFPANGATPEVAVDAIAEARLARVHRLSATMNVEVNLEYVANFATGQSDEDIIAQMQPLIEAFVRDQLSKSPLAFSNLTDLTGDLTVGGLQTAEQRLEIATAIANSQTLRDPRVVALSAAQGLYVLDDTWSVYSMYTEPNNSIVVIIRKYTNSTLTTLDSSETQQYVISVNPDNYNITGGIISPIDNP